MFREKIMKLVKKIMFAAFSLCLTLGILAIAAACKEKTPETPEPTTYSVTYGFGNCNGTNYAGSSTLPTEPNKEEGAKFNLAEAPVWNGYTFDGWSDGSTVYAANAEYTMPAKAVTLTATWEKESTTNAVTYALGECDGTAYAGNSVLPTETEKAEDAKFNLANAPVWKGYIFKGWSDGSKVYEADAEYTMPANAVTLTATWEKFVTDTNITLPTWNESATEGGYTILKGQYIKVAATVTSKETGDSAYGIPGKIFPNSNVSNNYYYQFRCDFAVKRTNGSWREDNYGFTVDEGGFVRDIYRESTAGETEITVALSEEGVLTYTFKYTSTSSEYSHTRVFTDNDRMNSAVVIFGTDHSTAENVTMEYPLPDAVEVKLDQGYDDKVSLRHFKAGSTYTIEADPYRANATFLGWQLNGEGDYYQEGGTFAVGNEDVTFVAAWLLKAKITIDKDGGKGNTYAPRAVYNEETEKYDITGVPTSSSLTKTGYAFKCWEISVNDEVITVEGDTFSVAPGATVVFKVVWGTALTVKYDLGECEGKEYDGDSKLPTEKVKAEGVVFELKPAVEWGGYTFEGWSDGTNTYAAGATYTMPAEAVTFTAQWTKLPHYHVTFVGGECDGVAYDGQGLIDTQEDMYEGATFPLAREIKWLGYTFLGWKEKGGEELYDGNERYTMPNHAVEFTAQWEKIPTHTVTYQPGAEGVLNMPTDETYYEGQIVMNLPIRFGYTFTGWSDGTNVYGPGTPITTTEENVTLTATWEALADRDLAILSGIWQLEDPDGDTIYFPISGMTAAWDAFKAIGSYKVGPYEVTSITETEIKFTMKLNLPTGSGTNRFGCTYNYERDTITMGYSFTTETLTRTTAKPDVSKIPTVSLETSSASVEEGSTVTLTPNVTYAEGDTKQAETYQVFVQSGSTFNEAEAGSYTLTENTFRPLVASVYKIKLTAVGTSGESASAEVTVTATVATIDVKISATATLSNGWLRLAADTDNIVSYTVEGYADGYDVTFTSSLTNATISAADASDGKQLSLFCAAPDTVIYQVVFTHKTDADKTVTLEIPVSFVSNDNAPVLGEDPFGGTYGTLIPSTGLMLYHDATIGGSQAAFNQVKYEVTDQSKLLDLREGGKVSFGTINGGQHFILIEDFDDGDNHIAHNKANGELTVKMTVTDSSGNVAAATKVFRVQAVASGDNATATTYMQAVLGDSFDSTVQFIGDANVRQNMVVSKTGIVNHRIGTWDIGSDFIRLDVNPENAENPVQNFRIDFKFTVLEGDNVCLSFGMRTVAWDSGWAGSIDFKTAGSEIDSWGWVENNSGTGTIKGAGDGAEGTKPGTSKGTVFYGRLTRTVVNGTVTYTASWCDTKDGTYLRLYSCNMPTSDTAGQGGAFVHAFQIATKTRSFYLEDFTFTNLDATANV